MAACLVLGFCVVSFILIKDFRSAKLRTLAITEERKAQEEKTAKEYSAVNAIALNLVDQIESLPESDTEALRKRMGEVFPLGSEGAKLIAQLKAMRPSKLLK